MEFDIRKKWSTISHVLPHKYATNQKKPGLFSHFTLDEQQTDKEFRDTRQPERESDVKLESQSVTLTESEANISISIQSLYVE